jgi:hypothetical protein
VHVVADASQKFTRPGVIAAPAALTCALRVATAPVATELTAFPPEVITKVVLVAVFDWAAAVSAPVQNNAASTRPVTAARTLCDRM